MKNTNHNIRFLKVNEADKLLEFISEHWAKNHVFTKSLDLLNWQHLSGDTYNFIGAFSDAGSIDAILGFIPISHYSKNYNPEANDISLAIWKVREEVKSLNLGLKLLYFLNKKLKPSSISSIGINEEVKKIYKALGFRISNMNHLFLTNNRKEEFKIAEISLSIEPVNKIFEHEFKLRLVDMHKEDILKSSIEFEEYSYFLKSKEYISNRYINHPFYNYQFTGLFNNRDSLIGLFICRVVDLKETTIMRIIDSFFFDKKYNFLDEHANIAFQKYLQTKDHEYVDVICDYSMLDLYKSLGFIQNTDDNFVPNKLEPLVKENSNIFYATNLKQDIGFHRGDSDQDRPNIIK